MDRRRSAPGSTQTMNDRERDTPRAGWREAGSRAPGRGAAAPGAQIAGGPGKTTLTQALAPDAAASPPGGRGRAPWLGGAPAMPPRPGAGPGDAPAHGLGDGGGGDALPYRRDMEAAFGEDLSGFACASDRRPRSRRSTRTPRRAGTRSRSPTRSRIGARWRTSSRT